MALNTITGDAAPHRGAALPRSPSGWQAVVFVPAALAVGVAVVALLRFGLNFEPDAAGDSFWLLIDLAMAIVLGGWGALRVYTDPRDGIGYLLQLSGLAWAVACLAEGGAVRPGAWTPLEGDLQVVAHLVARSLLVAAAVVVLPDRSADRFMRRGPLDAVVAGVTVVSLVVTFAAPASALLRETSFGFGNRAWIEAAREVPTWMVLVMLLAHVAAAAVLAWTRRGLPPTSFQVIGWVLTVAALPLAFDAVGSRFEPNLLDILALFVFPALPVLSVISVTRAVAAGTRTVRELRLAQRRMVEAVEAERRRLRRELHDGLGPALAGVALGVRAAGAQVAPERPDAARLLERLGDEIDTCLVEVRRIINDLRPPALDQLGLAGAVEAHAARLGDAAGAPSFAVHVDGLPAVTLPAAVELAAYRIASEAMTNAARHSGAARCEVRVAASGGDVAVEVSDDGVGLPADIPAGVGLFSMRERAAAVGGDVVIGAGAHGGTLVRARLPLEGGA